MSNLTITANFAARTQKGQTKTFTFPAYTRTFEQDAEGRWTTDGHKVSEAEVIDACKRATNWPSLRSANFPMSGFSS